MTALAAVRMTQSRALGTKRRVPINALSVIYAGGMVMLDAEGFARPAAALANNVGVHGVACESKTGGAADGDEFVIIQEGEFLMGATSVDQTSVGLKVYASDDQTVDETQATNEPVAGVLAEVVSATSCWVKIGITEALL